MRVREKVAEKRRIEEKDRNKKKSNRLILRLRC